MNIALIISGGRGRRTNNAVPKQYLTVNDKPVLVYTMQNIAESGCYEKMYVVCNQGWSEFVSSFAEQYNISIFSGTIEGGETRLESCANGVSFLNNLFSPNDIVSLVDGNRPLIPKRVFEESVREIEKTDGVIPLEPVYDSLYAIKKGTDSVESTIVRENIFRGQGPETSRLGLANEIYAQAIEKNFPDAPLTAMLLKQGKQVKFIEGSAKSFKLTTQDDFLIFKALI